MTATSVDFLKAEIARRQSEIEVLQGALEILTGGAAQKPKQKPRQLALPAPAEKPARKAEPTAKGDENFEVNGLNLVLTAHELELANALAEAEDCCSVDYLTELCGGKRQNLHNRVFSLNQKLKAAGAHIVFFKGEGYRLQNIEDS